MNLTEDSKGIRLEIGSQANPNGTLFNFRPKNYKCREKSSDHILLIGKYISYRFKFKGYVPKLNKVRIEAWLFNIIPIDIIFGEISIKHK